MLYANDALSSKTITRNHALTRQQVPHEKLQTGMAVLGRRELELLQYSARLDCILIGIMIAPLYGRRLHN